MRYVAVGVFALSCAFRVPGLAAFEGAVAAPVHCALAGSSLAMRGGLMAGTQNPSGLQGMDGPCAAAWISPGIFGIEGLNGAGCAVGLPYAGIPVALHVTSLGLHGYHEVTASLAAARRINGSAELGLRLNCDILSIRGYGSAAVPTLDAGCHIDVGSGCDLAFLCTNILAARIGPAGESLPVRLAAGCAYHPTSGEFVVYATCARELLSSPEWSAGIEYAPVPSFILRAGCSSEPALLCAGCAVVASGLKLEYAVVHHAQLGETHSIALSVGFD